MAEVLIGQSYHLRFDPKLWAAMEPYAPLGSLYAASYLRERGFEVAFFDAMLCTDDARWSEMLGLESPRFAVLFEDNFNYLSKMCLERMQEAALEMIRAATARGCTVICCGSDCTDQPEIYLDAGAHYILSGEGEQSLGELLASLTGRSECPVDQVRGLIYRGGAEVSGSDLVRTAPRPVLAALDELPKPAWDLIDVEHYREIWLRRHGRFSINLVATRGCPFHCNWCAKPIWGQGYKMRSAQSVAGEIAWLSDTYSPDHLWFADDILGLKLGWLSELADHLGELGVRVPFKCLSRADLLLRDGEVDALARAGAETVWMGAESGSQKILDAMDKGTRVEQIRESAAALRAAGIRVGFFLQFGYPGEERSDIEKTLQLVRDCYPDEIGISVAYPLPGTKFHKLVREQLGEKRNWTDSADLAMMYRGPFGTHFYRQLYRVVHREFRARRRARVLGSKLRRTAPASHREAGRLGFSDLREAFLMTAQFASLPFERWRLERLARDQGVGRPGGGDGTIRQLDSGMTAEDAAVPTPQVFHGRRLSQRTP